MPRPKAEVPLVRKIAQAFKAVGKLPRAGVNKKRRYNWTRATDVFEAVRSELFSRDVLILPNEGTPEYVAIGSTNGGEQMTECRLPVTYVFKDCKEELPPITINGVGRDIEDKAIYKAQTGAQKALLKRFGLMAEEADDPEWDGAEAETGETLDDVAPQRVPRREQPIRDFEIHAIEDACVATAKTAPEISETLCARFKVSELAKLKRWQFKDALAWASNGAGTLAPKPQAAPPLQSSMPFPKAAPSSELKIGNKSIELPPQKGSYAL